MTRKAKRFKMNYVQIGSDIMNKPVTSKTEILDVSRKIIFENGIDALNMREVASQCGAAVGSIYNYFPSKAELLSATVESIWAEIFKPMEDISGFESFAECISSMFDVIKAGDEEFSGFFDFHSLNFSGKEKENGKEVMKKYISTLEERLAFILKNDKNVRKGVFDNGLTEEKFVSYIFDLLIISLMDKEDNCRSLIELINNCIY